jgi:hypothetical protein
LIYFIVTPSIHVGHAGKDALGDRIGRVDGSQPIFCRLEERQRSQPKEGVEDVDGVAWPIANASFCVLALEDKVLERLLVNPVLLVHHAEGRVDPPRVAHVRQFLRPSVETPLAGLSLAQPLRKQLLIKFIDKSRDL